MSIIWLRYAIDGLILSVDKYIDDYVNDIYYLYKENTADSYV